MRVKCSAHDTPQKGHDPNYRHNPQVEPGTLDRELDKRGKEDGKGRYPFHNARPDSGNLSYASGIGLNIFDPSLIVAIHHRGSGKAEREPSARSAGPAPG